MTFHTVESTPETVRSGFLDPSVGRVATIASGDVVSYPNTWTHWGNEAVYGMTFADREPLRHRYPSGPYSMIGPVEVRITCVDRERVLHHSARRQGDSRWLIERRSVRSVSGTSPRRGPEPERRCGPLCPEEMAAAYSKMPEANRPACALPLSHRGYRCRRKIGGRMDRDNLQLAAKLLAKAENTNFDAEAAALAEKAYRLLAELLNAYESETGSTGVARRRERRHLRDRRAQWRVFSWRGPANGTDPATTYRRRAEETGEPGEGEIDLKA